MAGLPQPGFLFEIGGLGVTLAGFSGLVSAFRRGASKPIDAYRLRQIPEMGLATALVSLVTIPISDTGNGANAIQIAAGLGLLFTISHILVLLRRARSQHVAQPAAALTAAGLVDVGVIVAGAVGLGTGSAIAFEWFLILMLARPMLAFAFVFSDVGSA